MTRAADVDTYVGQKIRSRRKTMGLSQAALADAIGISYQQLQKYERGVNRVSAPMLVAIAEKLACRGADFLPDTAAPSSTDLGPALALAAFPNGLEIARAYLAMDPSRRQSFLGVVRALTAELGPSEALAAAQ